MMTATYSPEDNKLRLYPTSRLPKDLYDRVKAAGFSWAPKQELFVAPAWSPAREDLLIELCGDVGDEDTSLTDRAEQRAERFEDYSEKREDEAHRAHAAVESICDGIPLGQPILVGHHSERHARKHAEQIQSGMRKALRLWETSKYWTDRAAGAIQHAKYKELPAVRYRRIKKLEADLRKQIKNRDESQKQFDFWSREGLTREVAMAFANYFDHASYEWKLADYPRESPASQYEGPMSCWSVLEGNVATVEQVQARRVPGLKRYLEGNCVRWIAHYENRIAYERAMLNEQGGIAADAFDFQVGGQVLRRGQWFVIAKINRVGGVVNSVSVFGHFATTVSVDEIKDYKAPAAGDAEKVKAATTKGPLCNYPGPDIHAITQEQWDRTHKDHRGSNVRKASETHGTHRVRTVANFRLRGFGLTIKDQWGYSWVWIQDAKRKDAPGAPACAAKVELPATVKEPPTYRPRPAAEPTVFDAMAESLRAGVQVVTAPQLFPTPPEIARQVIELADIQPEQAILEPSAGTGNLIAAMRQIPIVGSLTAVEINHGLADGLRERFPNARVVCADFLATNGELGTFDRIVMNPPFANAVDIQHIRHAREKLRPGGRLVAVCANGPRQQAVLKPMASEWIDLPAGSFESSGTGVNAAIVVIDA